MLPSMLTPSVSLLRGSVWGGPCWRQDLNLGLSASGSRTPCGSRAASTGGAQNGPCLRLDEQHSETLARLLLTCPALLTLQPLRPCARGAFHLDHLSRPPPGQTPLVPTQVLWEVVPASFSLWASLCSGVPEPLAWPLSCHKSIVVVRKSNFYVSFSLEVSELPRHWAETDSPLRPAWHGAWCAVRVH